MMTGYAGTGVVAADSLQLQRWKRFWFALFLYKLSRWGGGGGERSRGMKEVKNDLPLYTHAVEQPQRRRGEKRRCDRTAEIKDANNREYKQKSHQMQRTKPRNLPTREAKNTHRVDSGGGGGGGSGSCNGGDADDHALQKDTHATVFTSQFPTNSVREHSAYETFVRFVWK